MAKSKAVQQHEEETTPTVEEAKQMFAENPGLAAVQTIDGNLLRDGTLVPPAE